MPNMSVVRRHTKYFLKEDRMKVQRVLATIGPQMPDQPEGSLWFNVLAMALKDLYLGETSRLSRDSAIYFLTGDMQCLAMCGIDPEWVKRVIREAGIVIPKL